MQVDSKETVSNMERVESILDASNTFVSHAISDNVPSISLNREFLVQNEPSNRMTDIN